MATSQGGRLPASLPAQRCRSRARVPAGAIAFAATAAINHRSAVVQYCCRRRHDRLRCRENANVKRRDYDDIEKGSASIHGRRSGQRQGENGATAISACRRHKGIGVLKGKTFFFPAICRDRRQRLRPADESFEWDCQGRVAIARRYPAYLAERNAVGAARQRRRRDNGQRSGAGSRRRSRPSTNIDLRRNVAQSKTIDEAVGGGCRLMSSPARSRCLRTRQGPTNSQHLWCRC